MRETVKTNRLDRRITLYLGCILVCAFLGPFGTSSDLTLSDRIVFWTLGISSVGFFMELCIHTAWYSEYLEKLPIAMRSLLGTIIGALPGSSCIILLNKIMRPDRLETVTFPELFAQVIVFAVIIIIIDLLINRRSFDFDPARERETPRAGSAKTAQKTMAEPAALPDIPDKAPRLLDRLSSALQSSQVISLSMQDHYVEITTTLGTEMLLMRLSDAIDLLEDTPGVQTHRSHWAATQSISHLIKDGRKHQIRLNDGRILPVSKSYLAEVTAALENT